MCSYVAPASYECTFIAYRLDIGHHHSPTKMLRAIAQGLSPTSSPMAESQDQARLPAPHNRYRDGAPPPGFFWLFAIRELVSNKPWPLRDPRSILVGEW